MQDEQKLDMLSCLRPSHLDCIATNGQGGSAGWDVSHPTTVSTADSKQGDIPHRQANTLYVCLKIEDFLIFIDPFLGEWLLSDLLNLPKSQLVR